MKTLSRIVLVSAIVAMANAQSNKCPTPAVTCVDESHMALCQDGVWATMQCGGSFMCRTLDSGSANCVIVTKAITMADADNLTIPINKVTGNILPSISTTIRPSDYDVAPAAGASSAIAAPKSAPPQPSR